MKHFLYGDDALALRAHKNYLASLFSEKEQNGQVHKFSFPEESDTTRLEVELSPGFFNEPKFLIVENLSQLHESFPERVESILESESPYDTVFVEYQKLPKSHPLIKKASKKMEVSLFEKKKRNVEELIHTLETELKLGKLPANAKNYLKEQAQNNEGLLLQNIQKILTYSEGKTLTQEELEKLVPKTLETKVFDALDALVMGQKERAVVLFQILLRQDDIFRILPLCSWQIRQMLLVQEASEKLGNQKDAIAKEIGAHPFVVQKILSVLPKFPRTRLAKGLKILASVDADLKQGRRTPEGALHHFVFTW